MTRSPAAKMPVLSAVSMITPANSLPGTNGGGTLIWYSLAISSTSGKFTAPAPTFTRTCPGASGSDGRSSMRTTSGGP